MKIKFLRTFAQLNIAVFLLLFIASFSIIGTIIEQDQAIDYYKLNYSNSFFYGNVATWEFLLGFGLDHVYRTWWFLALLFLFGTSLISCTFTQQFPVLKFARRCNFKFNIKEFERYDYYTRLKKIFFLKFLKDFKHRKYTIFHQHSIVYVYKGILGRFAPIIVHIAMLLILVGNVIAAFGSFNAQELIVKGEIFQIQNLVRKNFLTTIPEYPIRVNDFWIDYGANKNIKQFYSDLSILSENGNEILQKTISVNFPLRFRDLTFYQTDWNAIGLRVKSNQTSYQLPLDSLPSSKNIWVSWIPFFSSEIKGITFVTNSLNGKFFLYGDDGSLLGNFNIGDEIFQFQGLVIFEIIAETGLQIKVDLGIPLIYFGFASLMLSSLISYFSFTQFWLLKKSKIFLIGATSNRAKLDLRFEFLSLILPYFKKI